MLYINELASLIELYKLMIFFFHFKFVFWVIGKKTKNIQTNSEV